MENTEIKSGAKEVKNQIVLKNLTKRQKEILSSAGVIGAGVGLGGGLFSLYSMSAPNEIPELQNQTGENEEQKESVVIYTKTSVQEITDTDISFAEAFKMAREIVGPGGWFIWKDNVYNSFYKEEWEAMSPAEKNDYLATVDVLPKPENIASPVQEELIANLETETEAETIVAEKEDAQEPISEEAKPQVTVEEPVAQDNFNINFQDLYGQKSAPASEAAEIQPTVATEASKVENIIEGEIISLDDTTDLEEEGIFELEDDIQITLLPLEESAKLDSLTFDSAQITEFPWGEPVNKVESDSAIGINETAVTDEATTETEPSVAKEATAEAEPATTATPNETVESEEYPWGEPMEKKATIEEAIQNPEIQEPVAETTRQIISNPDEITEYPWGEPVTAAQPKAEADITGQVVEEAPVQVAQNPLPSSFDGIEEFPWGEKVAHVEPITETTPIETTGEIISAEPVAENENIGVILDELKKPFIDSQLPPSFSDITEYPWGEQVVHSPANENIANDHDTFASESSLNEPNELP